MFLHISFTFVSHFTSFTAPWYRGAVPWASSSLWGFQLGDTLMNAVNAVSSATPARRRRIRVAMVFLLKRSHNGLRDTAQRQGWRNHTYPIKIWIELVVSCINPSNIWAWRTHYTLSGGLSLDPQPSIKDTNCLRLMGSDQQRGVLIQFYPPGTQTIETCSWLHQGPTETEHHRNMK